MKVSLLQQILSYLFPVKITFAPGKTTPVLGLYRFRGRWQLSAATAIYSDGAAYRPLTEAFGYLKKELPTQKNMLVLGAGLGSAVSVLHKMNTIIADTTLVDIDPQVIEWGKDIIDAEQDNQYQWVSADVRDFVRAEKKLYDLIIVDVFQDRIVPGFVSSADFLKNCLQLMSKNKAALVLNYIVNNEASWKQAQAIIEQLFTVEHIIAIGINRILILRSNA